MIGRNASMSWEEWEKIYPAKIVGEKPKYIRSGPHDTYRKAIAIQNGCEIYDDVEYCVVQTQGD